MAKFRQLWQQKLSLWQFLEGLIVLGQNFEPTLTNFYAIGQIFLIVNSQMLKKLSSHVVTLRRRQNYLSDRLANFVCNKCNLGNRDGAK